MYICLYIYIYIDLFICTIINLTLPNWRTKKDIKTPWSPSIIQRLWGWCSVTLKVVLMSYSQFHILWLLNSGGGGWGAGERNNNIHFSLVSPSYNIFFLFIAFHLPFPSSFRYLILLLAMCLIEVVSLYLILLLINKLTFILFFFI